MYPTNECLYPLSLSLHHCRKLQEQLPNCLSVNKVCHARLGLGHTFGHQDFTWARGAASGLYRDLLRTCFPHVEEAAEGEVQGA